jgi:SNF2 family DNA or RNA helicase
MIRPSGTVTAGATHLTVQLDSPDEGAWALVIEGLRHIDHRYTPDGLAVTVPKPAIPALREALRSYPASTVDWNWDEDLEAVAVIEQGLADDLHRVIDTEPDVQAELPDWVDFANAGFTRELRDFQLRDVGRLLNMGNGANFSVPGSGKTTVAYAIFSVLREAGLIDVMAVVAPPSAFEAWEVEAHDCFGDDRAPSVGIRPGVVPRHLDVVVLNYERLERSRTLADLDAWMTGRRVLVVFDEAHRAKAGDRGVRGRAARTLAERATRRLVLTGTPMPNGLDDLAAVFNLAWPGHGDRLAHGDLARQRTRAFVRVVKSELHLPQLDMRTEYVNLEPAHRRIYDALSGEAVRLLESPAARDAAQVGRAVLRLIAAAGNPAVVLDPTTDFAMPYQESEADISTIMSEPGAHVRPSKLVRVRQLVVANASVGRKTLVWSNFVGNVRALADILSDHSPAVVVGATPVEDASAPTDRRRELERFRSDPQCSVLIATPQTLGEGVSLHRVCHDQVHFDRGFAAGTFLQSLDRTHRLGLPADAQPTCTLLVARDTIDEHVHAVLERKVGDMADALQDPSLRSVADPMSEGDLTVNDLLLGSSDVAELTAFLRSALR